MKKLRSILLIDDSEATNFANQILLEKFNLTDDIKIAMNGKEALELISKKENSGKFPELIFLDLNMPELDGWGFLEEYEKLPKSESGLTVIIVLSSSTNPKDREKASSIGFVGDFVSKPLTKEKINDIITTYFKRYGY